MSVTDISIVHSLVVRAVASIARVPGLNYFHLLKYSVKMLK